MAIYKLHTFYLPVYRELLPDDWKGESDPRAPRMLFRGPTVSEFHEMFGVDHTVVTGEKLVRDVARQAKEMIDQLRPMVRRSMGDWSLAGLDGQGVDHLPLTTAEDFFRAWMGSGRPDEDKDVVPLGDGGQPA